MLVEIEVSRHNSRVYFQPSPADANQEFGILFVQCDVVLSLVATYQVTPVVIEPCGSMNADFIFDFEDWYAHYRFWTYGLAVGTLSSQFVSTFVACNANMSWDPIETDIVNIR